MKAGFADVAEAMGISNAFTSLASYNAFIVNLKAVNVTAGYGNGSTGGFRFRAMSDRDMDGGNIPCIRCHVRQQETEPLGLGLQEDLM